MSELPIVGIDVDARWLVIARFGQAGGPQRIANTPAGIGAWLAGLPGACRMGLESTSRYHETLVRLAQAAGHTVFVLNPRDVRHYALGVGRRGKTDRVDAQVIARYVAKEGEHLRPYLARTASQQQMHALMQQRRALVRSRAQLEQSLAQAQAEVSGPILRAIRQALDTLDQAIAQRIGQGDTARLHRRLMTIPGVGPVIAAQLAHHLTRWPLTGANAWIACTGLDPRPNDSGARTGVRRLSKRGDPHLRQMLYMAGMSFARSAWGKPIALARKQQGHSSTAIFNILARKIARIAWALFKSGNTFDPARMTP